MAAAAVLRNGKIVMSP